MERTDPIEAGASIPCSIRSSSTSSPSRTPSDQRFAFSAGSNYLQETNRYYDTHFPVNLDSEQDHITRLV